MISPKFLQVETPPVPNVYLSFLVSYVDYSNSESDA